MPRKEQSRAESYQTGDRVRVAIVRVAKAAKGPQVIVSRTDPALLTKLFEMEVPEIYDGTVQIRGAVREAGERAKVAVVSRERDVDPVGACVGMKGTRVQSIIRELRGEKIDIVEWSEDPAGFVVNALSPAKVSRVSVVDEEQKIMEVVVEDKQLSLAIGKKGQNVRLAAKLVGWRIDIKSEEEKRREVEAEMARMARAVDEVRSLTRHGIAEATVQRLVDSGVGGLAHLLELPDEELVDVAGIDAQELEPIREAAAQARIEWDEQRRGGRGRAPRGRAGRCRRRLPPTRPLPTRLLPSRPLPSRGRRRPGRCRPDRRRGGCGRRHRRSRRRARRDRGGRGGRDAKCRTLGSSAWRGT